MTQPLGCTLLCGWMGQAVFDAGLREQHPAWHARLGARVTARGSLPRLAAATLGHRTAAAMHRRVDTRPARQRRHARHRGGRQRQDRSLPPHGAQRVGACVVLGGAVVRRGRRGQGQKGGSVLSRRCRPRPFPAPPLCCSIRVQNVGLHGNGELQWWALRVKPGREKQVRRWARAASCRRGGRRVLRRAARRCAVARRAVGWGVCAPGGVSCVIPPVLNCWSCGPRPFWSRRHASRRGKLLLPLPPPHSLATYPAALSPGRPSNASIAHW